MKNYFYYDETIKYPLNAPYHPENKYKEYPFKEIGNEKNDIYIAIRESFQQMKLDEENQDTNSWNPLGNFIIPGQTVLIKPNLVNNINPAESDFQKGMDCMITHPSLVRCIFDYVYIALQGKGNIIIADAPIQGCDFNKLLKCTGYGELFQYVQEKSTEQLFIKVGDLRETIRIQQDGKVTQRSREKLEFDSHVIDLRNASYFAELDGKHQYRVIDYDGKNTMKHHSKGCNEYKISDVALLADVIINIPKPKTHRIAGYTGALKNVIGINSKKEYLPHHQKGSKIGDEYIGTHVVIKWINSTSQDIRNWAIKNHYEKLGGFANKIGRKIGIKLDTLEPNRKKFGMWYGNDTIWRTILDVNHIIYNCDKKGIMRDTLQRKVLHVGDMIVCGEGEGPLRPSYKRIGGILFSDNPVAFDLIEVKLMGFEWNKFPVLVHAMKDNLADNMEMYCYSNVCDFIGNIDDLERQFDFTPTNGWKDILLFKRSLNE